VTESDGKTTIAHDQDLHQNRQPAHLKEGDAVNVEVHAGGTITMAPLSRRVIEAGDAARTARRLSGENSELFRRLA
jgi:hypothetical protein